MSGSLKNDNSAMGITVKVVLVAVALAFVVLPLKAMMGSKSEQKQWKSRLRTGIRESGHTLAQELGSARKVGSSLSREGNKIASRIRGRF